MKRFRLGQRVLVRRAAGCRDAYREDGVELDAVGIVVRLQFKDDGAWIDLGERAPDGLHPFPANDGDGRGTWVLTWPDWCEAVKTTTAAE